MSSYSLKDVQEAFECAEKNENPHYKLFYVVRDRVIAHLDGKCHCSLRRCPKCQVRPRNGITFHKPGCPMAVRS